MPSAPANQVREQPESISRFWIIPAFVQNNELDAVPAGKINVIFIGVHVDARLKRNPFQIPVVPPVPRHFPLS